MSMLETQRLVLRPVTVDDAADVARLFEGDWEAVKQTGRMPYPASEAAMRVWLTGHTTPSTQSFVVRLKDQQAVIGAVGFGGGGRTAELGYAFGRLYWGKGYATEAVVIVIARARGLGLRRLDAYSFIENPASARVLEKVGFYDLGIAVREYPKRGGLRRVRHYRMAF